MQKTISADNSGKYFTLDSRQAHRQGRAAMKEWQAALRQNFYTVNPDFQHSIRYYFPEEWQRIDQELERFGKRIATELEPLVAENDERLNLPRLEPFDGIGERQDEIVHHPSYLQAGAIIYGSSMMEKLSHPGKMLESLSHFYLSSHAGEAGHNCPVACTAGVIRILGKFPEIPNQAIYLKKLIDPNFQTNYIGAQFVTEVQGGSDVGMNDTVAVQDADGKWRITGEKWFCSSADADLILMTARFDESLPGTKGLGLFLVPRLRETGEKNHYQFRRLKEKIGTRTMATAEADFYGAYAYPVGELKQGFKLLMENVLHLSRIYNSFATLGAGNRAYQIARTYVSRRIAFNNAAIDYPLVKENLARIKAENTAMLSSIMATTQLQDQFDKGQLGSPEIPLLLRLLANLNKYVTALKTVDHVHHAIDMLAGNGTIETFSPLPRLLRDAIVFENWEGTHNTLRMQILRDIHKYRIDQIFLDHVDRQLNNLKGEEQWNAPLLAMRKRLQQSLTHLKNQSAELQALLIKQAVDEMALLYCALSLLIEALHQQKAEGQTSKLDTLRYFYQLHFRPEHSLEPAAYLSLISKIVVD